QRPNVRETIERDIDLLFWLARVIENTIPESAIYRPSEMVTQSDRAITAELDFVLEADHAERFAKNFGEHPTVRFPRIYREASGRRVLTLEFFDGKKVFDAVAAGASGKTIARNSVGIVVKMIFEDGFFHADPHPGNIIILGPPSEPVVGLIDLGLVGQLSEPMRDKAIDMMVAAVR